VPGLDDLVLAAERVHHGNERRDPRVRLRLLHQRPGHRPAHLLLAAGVQDRPPAGLEDAQDAAPLRADQPASGQPLVKRPPQVPGQRRDHRRGLLALMRDDDLQGRVEHGIADRGRVTDDDAPRLALIHLAGEVYLVHQGELKQVRAAQPGVDLGGRHRQPAAGAVGEQKQKILSQKHRCALSARR